MSRFVEANTPVIRSLATAFQRIQQHSWPESTVEKFIGSSAFASMTDPEAVRAFWDQVQALCQQYPSLRMFWKDAELRFLGVDPTLVTEAGFDGVNDMVGRLDDDPQLPWARQAAKYWRDDRKVMDNGVPEFDILERQDAGGGETRWLRTSKAPIMDGDRCVGLIGAFDIISHKEATKLGSRL